MTLFMALPAHLGRCGHECIDIHSQFTLIRRWSIRVCDRWFVEVCTGLNGRFQLMSLISCTTSHVEDHIRVVPLVPSHVYRRCCFMFQLGWLQSRHPCLSNNGRKFFLVLLARVLNVLFRELTRGIFLSFHRFYTCYLGSHHRQIYFCSNMTTHMVSQSLHQIVIGEIGSIEPILASNMRTSR